MYFGKKKKEVKKTDKEKDTGNEKDATPSAA
jgi:hypothetical protein